MILLQCNAALQKKLLLKDGAFKNNFKVDGNPQLLQSIEMLSLIVHANMAFSGVLMAQLPIHLRENKKRYWHL